MVAVTLLLLASATQVAVASIGQISDLRGTGEIVRKGDKFIAKLSFSIEQLDNVQTGNGRLEIKFVDDSTVKMTEHSKLVIDDFVFSGKPDSSKMALKFAAGTVRFATGQTGGINKQNINLRTPTATIAVRGTDFASTVDEFGKSLVILLPEENGNVGEITVSNGAGSVILNRAFQATLVSTLDSRPSQPVILNLDLNQINNMLIITPPSEIRGLLEVQDKRSNILDLSDLDIDFLKDSSLGDALANDLLNRDPLKDDYLNDDPFSDCAKRDNVKLCGTIFGLDPSTQFSALVTGDYLRITRSQNYIVDFKFKKDSGELLIINSNGKTFEITVNEPAGGSKIIINQSN